MPKPKATHRRCADLKASFAQKIPNAATGKMANVLRRRKLFPKHHKLSTLLAATHLQNSDPKVLLDFKDQAIGANALSDSFKE